ASHVGAAQSLVTARFDAADLGRAIRYAGTQAAARRALRESALQNNRLAAAIDTLRAGVFLTDPQQPANPIVFHNKGLRELTGLTAAEISDHNFCELPGFDSGAVEIRRIQAALAEHKTHEGTLLHRRGDGREWWGQLLLQPLFDTSGALLNYIGVLTDASDHIRAEQVLRHYNRALHVSSQCRRVVARAATEDELLREICHIIVQAGG